MAVRAAPRRAYSTAPHTASVDEQLRARWARRAVLLLFLAFLGLGAGNLLGPKMASVEATAEGVTLRADYVAVARPGLHTQWSLTVSRHGGFPGPVVLAVGREYVSLFKDVVPLPQPESTAATAEAVLWSFAPPPGTSLTVDVDARVSPSLGTGADGFASVVIDGRPVVSVRFHTRILP